MAPSLAPGNAEIRKEATTLAAEAYWLLAPGQGEMPVEQIYNLAMDQLQQEDYRSAVPIFEEVERQHLLLNV